jgi:hypothetical protein
MTESAARRLRALAFAVVAAVCAAGCASNRLLDHQANPEYVGKPFKRVLVVAVTNENVLGRVYEDRMVALLGQRGIQGIPGYSALGTTGAVDEATLRSVIAKTGADGMLITRTTGVDQATVTSPGQTAVVGFGVGWGGFYGYYSGVWKSVYVPPQTTDVGPPVTTSETRLFDARSGTLAWRGTIATKDRDGDSDTTAAVQQYAGIVFDAMAGDGVI